MLKSLHGDYFTKFLGEGKAKTKYSKTKREQIIPFVVMELADCNLEDKIKKLQINKEIVEYEEYAGQFRGLARALKVLHKESIIHRDIKPENILVVGSKLVLSDFGICTRVQKGYTYITPEGVNVGPKYWLSPEAHNRRLGCGDNITMASDVFQLATIFWYVVNGRHPCGIVSKKDWKGPEKLFDCIHRSLYHDYRLRPKNGIEFLKAIEGALST